MDTVRAMQLLVLAVGKGSLSAAGRQLGMSPAASTRHITALEDRLGTRLLNRSSRSLTLTEAGQDYFEAVRDTLYRLSAAESRVRELGGQPSGTVRVHAPPLMGEQFVVAAIPEFLRLYPQVNLSIMMSNGFLNLHEHNLDVGIRIGRPADSSYTMRKLGEVPRILVAAPRYLSEAPPLIHPDDLIRHQCLIYSQFNDAAVWSLRNRSGQRLDISVNGRFVSDYGLTLRTMAIGGAGLAMLPRATVRSDIEAGRLVHCLTNWEPGHVGFNNDLYAVFLRERHVAVKTRVFIDYLIEFFRKNHAAE